VVSAWLARNPHGRAFAQERADIPDSWKPADTRRTAMLRRTTTFFRTLAGIV